MCSDALCADVAEHPFSGAMLCLICHPGQGLPTKYFCIESEVKKKLCVQSADGKQ